MAGGTALGTRVAVGCILLPASFFGGGMIGVLVAKVVDFFTRCVPAQEMPACHTFEFFFPAAIVGVVVVEGWLWWRLRGAGGDQSDRS